MVLGLPRNPEDQVRIANSIARCLSIVRKGHRAAPKSVPSVAELMARRAP